MYVGSGKKILKEGEQGNFGVFLQNMLDSFEPMGRFVKRYDRNGLEKEL